MSAIEPTPERLGSTPLRLALATRPAFLAVTAAGCVVGWGAAYRDTGGLCALDMVSTLALALVAHAAVNVANDYYDARNGCDAGNTGRIFPYTGGSRMIQNGVLSAGAMGAWAALLGAVVVAGGIALALSSGAGLLAIGVLGLFIGWAYSAPPLWLAARGLGEIAVTAGFLLIVLGAYFVQRGAIGMTPVLAGTTYALMVANLLYVNQIPDAEADARAGKRTLVVRLGVPRAHLGYLALLGGAALVLAAAVIGGALPAVSLVTLGALVPGFVAWRLLVRVDRVALARAIVLTIGAALGTGVLLGATLAAGAPS